MDGIGDYFLFKSGCHVNCNLHFYFSGGMVVQSGRIHQTVQTLWISDRQVLPGLGDLFGVQHRHGSAIFLWYSSVPLKSDICKNEICQVGINPGSFWCILAVVTFQSIDNMYCVDNQENRQMLMWWATLLHYSRQEMDKVIVFCSHSNNSGLYWAFQHNLVTAGISSLFRFKQRNTTWILYCSDIKSQNLLENKHVSKIDV